ncbi:hypothetical protein CHN51_07670 [Sphingorhabdus sp. YGSMI21]|nr:hypothetical protein CHN51_07670 [Sphingorhabdus sp. YGSMI21]
MFGKQKLPAQSSRLSDEERTRRLNSENIKWQCAYRPHHFWLGLILASVFLSAFTAVGAYFWIAEVDTKLYLGSPFANMELDIGDTGATIFKLLMLLIPLSIIAKIVLGTFRLFKSSIKITDNFLVHDMNGIKLAWEFADIQRAELVPLTKGRSRLTFIFTQKNSKGDHDTLETTGKFDPASLRSALANARFELDFDPSLDIFRRGENDDRLAPGEPVYWSQRLGIGAIQNNHVLTFVAFLIVFSLFVLWMAKASTSRLLSIEYDGPMGWIWELSGYIMAYSLPVILLGFPLLGAFLAVRKPLNDLISEMFGTTIVTDRRIITTKAFGDEIYHSIDKEIITDAAFVKQRRFGSWILVETKTIDDGSSDPLYTKIHYTGVQDPETAVDAIRKMARL